MPTPCQHVFFDLDHTLWDFDRNAEVCLHYLWQQHGHPSVNYEAYLATFRKINREMWNQLERHEITQEYLRANRFRQVFEAIGLPIDARVGADMNAYFLENLSLQPHLIEGAAELLEHLHGRFGLHIITNGFAEIQQRKMEHSGIARYFSYIITHDVAHARKPDPAIFRFALQAAGATPATSVYVGDDPFADVEGGIKAGLPVIHFNPGQLPTPVQPTHTVQSLKEIADILIC